MVINTVLKLSKFVYDFITYELFKLKKKYIILFYFIPPRIEEF